ncbi:MAG: phage holin family protein [Bacteroidia bacterium]
MKFIINIIVTTLAVIITAWLLPGVKVDSVMTAVLVAVVLAFLNAVVKPILTILTIPITFFTLGFFLLVINALMIIIVTKLVAGFQVDGFWKALLFSLILSLTTSILHMFAGSGKDD